jgi:endonuclease III
VGPEEVADDPDAGIAVDTHVGRLSVRLGLTKAGPKDAEKVEKDLMAITPRQLWPRVSFLLIEHGRKVCDAKRPRCDACVVEHLCPSSRVAGKPDLFRRALDSKKKRVAV